VIGFLGIIYSFKTLKDEKEELFLQKSYINNVDNIQDKIKTLIREKLNATKTIALGLSENQNIADALKTENPNIVSLKDISKSIRHKTNFKNVWFQLISKDGVSIKRSWTEKRGDSLVETRDEIRDLIKNPKMLSTIDSGKFDLNLKVIIPIYSKEKELLGFFETITHFNSIAKKIKEDEIDIIILANKKQSATISDAYTKNIVQGFYVANFVPNNSLLSYLKNRKSLDSFILNLQKEKFIIEEKYRLKISCMPLKTAEAKKVGHIVIFSKIKKNETSLDFQTIAYAHTIYGIIALSFWTIIIYLIFSIKEKHVFAEISSRKPIFYLILFLITTLVIIYYFLENRLSREIGLYKESEKVQIVNEYNLIKNKNIELANFIFKTLINQKEVIELFEHGKREELYNLIKHDYEELVKLIHIRQLHFHTKESASFLRMHRPKKFGDSLVGIRESVEYVNKHQDPFYGFEEGRIFNGFRHVFPVYGSEEQHIGSVEISFDSLTFIESYLNSFGKKANFLLRKDTVEEKVFDNEKSNYSQSAIDGFYYDKQIFGVLEWNNKRFSEFGKKELFKEAKEKILSGQISIVHIKKLDELLVIMPIVNKASGKVVASIVISKSDKYIQDRKDEFLFTFTIIALILFFISIFIYREIVLKDEITKQSKRIRRILDSQESIIIITDGINILDFNRALLQFFNVKDAREFNHKYGCICDQFEKVDGYIQKDMGGESWLDYALKNRKTDIKARIRNWRGETKIFKFEARSYAGKNKFIVSLLDISQIEESHIEIKKRSAEQRDLLSLFDIGGIALFRWRNDENWSVEYLSRNAETLFGHGRTDFLSAKVRYRDLVHEEDKKSVQEEVEIALKSDEEFFSHKPYRIVRKDGSIRWVLDYTLLIKNSYGEVSHFLGYIVDITDLKDFEQKARDVQDRFQLAIDGANDGLWDWKVESDQVYYSPRWKEMLGYKDHEISSSFEEWKSRVHKEDFQKSLENVEEHLSGKTPIYENEHRLLHKDGHWVWILTRGKALFDKNGKPIRMVGFHTDISQKKKYEEELQKLIEEKTDENSRQWDLLQQQSKLAVMGEMMGAIAHQWRQPLNALSIHIQELQDDFEDDLIDQDFVDEFIRKNQNIILFMSKTVEDFRNFFKVDKQRVLFSVREAIENTIDIQIAQLKSHNVIVELNGDDFMVNGFKSEFQQVILNLVGNSKDAILEQGKQDGKVEIILSGNTVIVRDNGGGIPEKVLKRIFEPYFTTKDGEKGTGIGLYMSKMIIEDNMNGSIIAQNTSYGAEFIIKMN
jgi:PAS domain S-box-containing protein